MREAAAIGVHDSLRSQFWTDAGTPVWTCHAEIRRATNRSAAHPRASRWAAGFLPGSV